MGCCTGGNGLINTHLRVYELIRILVPYIPYYPQSTRLIKLPKCLFLQFIMYSRSFDWRLQNSTRPRSGSWRRYLQQNHRVNHLALGGKHRLSVPTNRHGILLVVRSSDGVQPLRGARLLDTSTGPPPKSEWCGAPGVWGMRHTTLASKRL